MNWKTRLRIAAKALRGKPLDAARVITEGARLSSGTVGIFGGLTENRRDTFFEQVTVKDLEAENLETLLPKVIASDPAIDQAVDFFTTLVGQGHTVTAETSRGEQGIAEIHGVLEENRTPLRLAVAHCASSLIMRGDICAETEFDESAHPKNFWVHDPKWVEWRYLTEKQNARWALGQYDTGNWGEIDSPNVFYLSGNPLIGERSSRSPLQTALFPAISQTAMIRSLQSILDIHAWGQTLFAVKKLALMQLEADGAEVTDVNAQINEAMNLIATKLAKKRPDEIMGMTDDIEPVELSGAGSNYAFVKELGELFDKRTSMGSKVPSTVGGPSAQADYSTKHQGLFYSTYLQAGQENVKSAVEWAFRRFLRSMGITDEPIYTSKSVNVESRSIEAKAFQELMTGIDLAVKAGMSLPVAIAFFEEETGQTLSAAVKARIGS